MLGKNNYKAISALLSLPKQMRLKPYSQHCGIKTVADNALQPLPKKSIPIEIFITQTKHHYE